MRDRADTIFTESQNRHGCVIKHNDNCYDVVSSQLLKEVAHKVIYSKRY
jgi:hypothetical protein